MKHPSVATVGLVCALANVPSITLAADAATSPSTTENATLKLPDACTWSSERLRCPDANGKSVDATVPGMDEGTIGKARAGDGIAVTLLGDLYAGFLPNNLKDGSRAFSLFTQAAKVGVPGAMFGLGYLYERGLGVPADDALAERWFETAANAGSVQGMFWTANSYENGVGVPKDEARAIEWYRLTADQGDTGAMGALSLMYRDGRGAPTDNGRADQWWSRYISTSRPNSHTAEEILAQRVRDKPAQNIAGFIPYCMGHFNVCRLAVDVTNFRAIASGQRVCGMSKDADQPTKQTLGWLVEHHETQGMAVRDGILSAIKSIWPG